MNVTHLNSYFFSNKLHENLLIELSERNIHQKVFIPLIKSEVISHDIVKKYPNIEFGIFYCFSDWQRKYWPFKMIAVWKAFLKFENTSHSDINHAHTLIVNGLIAFLAKKKFGTPYIVTIRNTDVNVFIKKSKIFRWLGYIIMTHAEAVITISPAYWNKQIKLLYPEKKLQRIDKKHFNIPNGIDNFWLENLYHPKSCKTPLEILFVGKLNRNKNLKSLLEACNILIDKGEQLILRVVGTGPLENEFKKIKNNFDIIYEGYITDKNKLLKFYRNADLLVIPSRTESFGLIYAESMSQGTPVVYTEGQGFDGFFKNDTIGFAVKPTDIEEIAESILRIKNNYKFFSFNSLEKVVIFNWNRSVNDLYKLYTNIKNLRSEKATMCMVTIN